MNTLIPLQWDSNFFNFNVAKIDAKDLNEEALNNIVMKAKEEKVDLVYAFANPKDIDSNKSLQSVGNLIDEKVTYVTSVNDDKFSKDPQIHEYKDKLATEALITLALQSGVYSRFRRDNHFTEEQYKRLYTTWLTNSLNGKIASNVLVYVLDGKEVGFITLSVKNKRGDIGLLAVDEKQRGKHIGKKLMHAAFAAFQTMGIDTIQVVTQKNNIGACAFYEKIGCTVESVENVYHIWL